MNNKSGNSIKKVPERMCVSCRQMKPKTELVRIVNVGNSVIVDTSGKINGRGVYLCKNNVCVERALKNKKFTKTYGFALSEVERELEKIIEQQD